MQLVLLFGLMLIGALAEMLSLGAIVPFLAILADPVQALQRTSVARVVDMLGLDGAADLRWRLTLVFAAFAVAAGLVRFALIYVIARVNYGIGHEIGAEVYRRTLYQPYEVHIARNSSQILGGLNKVDGVVWVMFSLLNAVSAALMGLCIVAALLFIDPRIATTALLCFGSIYGLVFVSTRKRLAANSRVTSAAYTARVQSVQEGLGGIRDVLLDQAQPVFAHRFNQADWQLRQAQGSTNIIGPSPRFAVEALGMTLIALLGYYMTGSRGGLETAIPTLGALALGAQRLLPLFQSTYQGWVLISGERQSLVDVVALLEQSVQGEATVPVAPLPLEREVRLERVSFRYQPSLPLVLHEIDLTIRQGTRVGFVGATGSGKSTMMDLLMGLLRPSEGRITVDDNPLDDSTRLAWQRNIAHVPQALFLADASFSENIAFGVPIEQIDKLRVRQAAHQAQISEFIESTSEKYATKVGERGVRLSGGQRQRIGIARALYKQAKVLVFDEATSALDNETEAAVMQAIQGLGRELTIILIAHRVSTLGGCDVIYRLHEGHLISGAAYDALMEAPEATASIPSVG